MHRTSLSHPLQIAEVQAQPGLGRIGLTFCPGKQQAQSLSGGWRRDLNLDVAAIAAWNAAAVVTLVEDHELRSLGVEGLGQTMRSAAIDWIHAPIRDVSAPDERFEAVWSLAGEGLRARLRSGAHVLVHCKGGLGRAGLVAAKLAVELGAPPEKALVEVRRVRPGAIETGAQEAYVRAQRPAPEPRPATHPEALRDRARGALLGLAVGDAVGTTLEFSGRDARPWLTDMVGGGPFGLKPGQWTDDTAMALALAESLAERGGLDPADLMGRFVGWWREGTYSCTGRCFDIGGTTASALRRFELSGDPLAGATDPNSAGNGSLMRLSPVALRYWRDPRALADAAARQSITTHRAPEAVGACVFFAARLAAAIRGDPRSAIFQPCQIDGPASLAAIAAGSWRARTRAEIGSSGYVLDSLEAALWAVARTADFRSAVLLAANLGGDADTVAAITGQLAGAIYGASAIPPEWLARLAWRERLTEAADQLVAHAG